MLYHLFSHIKDSRVVGRTRYEYANVLFIVVLALLSNAKSYRQIAKFITVHYDELAILLDLHWGRVPAYTTLRDIIRGIDYSELEALFREHASYLSGELSLDNSRSFVQICFDGKTLRGSDIASDGHRLIQFLNGYMVDSGLIICHAAIDTKTNEIPTFQKILKELAISHSLLTLDAMHCQKKLL